MAHTDINTLRLDRAGAEMLASRDPGPIERGFFGNTGRPIHKWIHFLPVYDRWISPFAGRGAAMLEIGVQNGGSLQMWRRILGPEATVFGVDIDPACAGRVEAPNEVRIGSQDDAAFLAAVLDEMGGVDIVLDDGSHIGRHQWASFRAIWPRMRPGGVYMIEDLHTSYWPGEMEGGMRKPGTGVELAKALIDDQHGWYHGEPEQLAPKEEIGGIHMHDSIVVIEKVAGHRPGHVVSG